MTKRPRIALRRATTPAQGRVALKHLREAVAALDMALSIEATRNTSAFSASYLDRLIAVRLRLQAITYLVADDVGADKPPQPRAALRIVQPREEP